MKGKPLNPFHPKSTMSSDVSYLIGKELVETKYHQEKEDSPGENFHTTSYAELDIESYNEVLKVEYEAWKKKREIIKKSSKGGIRFWNASFTDTLTSEYIYSQEQGEEAQNV